LEILVMHWFLWTFWSSCDLASWQISYNKTNQIH